jgi:hypothetical protein
MELDRVPEKSRTPRESAMISGNISKGRWTRSSTAKSSRLTQADDGAARTVSAHRLESVLRRLDAFDAQINFVLPAVVCQVD